MAGVQDAEKRGVFVEVKNVMVIDIGDVCDMLGIEEDVEVGDMDMSIGIADFVIEVEVVLSGMSIVNAEVFG